MKALIFALALASPVAFGAPSPLVEEGPSCVEFQVVEGTEDVLGNPDAEKLKAYGNWKGSCEVWKEQVRELNKDNQIIAAGCSRPKAEREGALWVYRGTGLYKVKTRIRDSAAPRVEK